MMVTTCNHELEKYLDHMIDTLLNVFLAIAVDNLANAQELTAAEEEAVQLDEQVCDTDN